MSKRIELSGKNILLFSNEPWGDVWFSKHHYAVELSKKNTVYFINPTGSWSWKNLFQLKARRTLTDRGIIVIDYLNYLPGTGRSPFMRKINDWLVSRLILHAQQKKQERIYFSFDPIRFSNPASFSPVTSIYYCVDDHEHLAQERTLSENVDHIFVVSDALKEKKFSLLNKPIHLLPHGIPENPFPLEERLSHPEKNQAIFAGSLNYRMNYALLYELAFNNPDCVFKMFGKVDKKNFSNQDSSDFDRCEALQNIRFEGPVPYPMLAGHILESKICLLISKTDQWANILNSLKILQYLSYGKTVIANYFEAYKHAEKDLLYMPPHNQYVSCFSQKLQESSTPASLREFRIRYADTFSYDRLLEQIELVINAENE